MGKLTQRKTKLTFETASEVRYRRQDRALIIEAEPTHVVIRLKGTRQRLSLSWDGIYAYAALKAADKVRAEKKAAKKKAGLR